MEMYFVVTPLNTNYRVGDSGGDMTIHEAPTAAYYESADEAIAAAKVINAEILEVHTRSMKVYGPPTEQNNKDALSEQGAFVMLVVWNPVQ